MSVASLAVGYCVNTSQVGTTNVYVLMPICFAVAKAGALEDDAY